MLKNPAQYNKLWVALIGAVVQAVAIYFGVGSSEYNVLIALLTAVGVHSVPNVK